MLQIAKTFANSPVLRKTHKLSFAGAAAVGAVALGFSLVPAEAQTAPKTVSAAPVAFSQDSAKDVKASVVEQVADANKQAAAAAAKEKAAAAAQERAQKAAASRSAQRAELKAAAAKAVKTYPNNLDGWIRESLDIMKKHNIPGTYNGLHKNIIRESSGNPNAINDWDINAQNGIPSIGLLQVIKPTFDTYHVPGTAWSQYDPVANITAAANYAAHRYGSIDNVNSAY
ncbi:lytic transglycosylase [Streptomyces ipomoeae]|uniref:Transglycosylase SLT domain protein n=2 Tax=Streptomyces ipomoeae TaxID=103232 RepID=L1L6J0_9ACTN|nr:transglycosylase SLT domain-containing protein [Streptomyces ipomoeae]EKX68542.1 transglycosylase SLT domain protein [Streptomyces ipomoeae 91-03]MDX2698531.1 transglycosylase SLT domain-containing protein [Streptomyces ipomoeae]MDX2825907.1 transglycosylase SLT domain-containing protein [Streptomyces ipomoeae]MDX2844243.1 transglycosylase SLT domain-containing protein [Streptomyces ipomoeae]MDX2878629.1 transglycosylase SLT domain-containing protein [Streptomyces ipomoeae]